MRAGQCPLVIVVMHLVHVLLPRVPHPGLEVLDELLAGRVDGHHVLAQRVAERLDARDDRRVRLGHHALAVEPVVLQLPDDHVVHFLARVERGLLLGRVAVDEHVAELTQVARQHHPARAVAPLVVRVEVEQRLDRRLGAVADGELQHGVVIHGAQPADFADDVTRRAVLAHLADFPDERVVVEVAADDERPPRVVLQGLHVALVDEGGIDAPDDRALVVDVEFLGDRRFGHRLARDFARVPCLVAERVLGPVDANAQPVLPERFLARPNLARRRTNAVEGVRLALRRRDEHLATWAGARDRHHYLFAVGS